MTQADPLMANVYKLRKEYRSNLEIAEELGVDTDTVTRYITRAEEFVKRCSR